MVYNNGSPKLKHFCITIILAYYMFHKHISQQKATWKYHITSSPSNPQEKHTEWTDRTYRDDAHGFFDGHITPSSARILLSPVWDYRRRGIKICYRQDVWAWYWYGKQTDALSLEIPRGGGAALIRRLLFLSTLYRLWSSIPLQTGW